MNTGELMEKIAEVAPREYRFIVKTAKEVKESPFREEILEELEGHIEKVANSMLGRFGGAAAGVGATVATGIAFSLAGDMYDSLKRGITKGRNYKAMLRDNPDLAEMPASDVQRAFSTLHRFNPDFAADPTVAGSFVRRQANFLEFDPKQLTDLVSSRKSLADTRKLPIPGRVPWEDPAMRSAQLQNLQSQAMNRRPPPPTARGKAWAAGNSAAYRSATMGNQLAPGGGGPKVP